MDPCRAAQEGLLSTFVQVFVERQQDQGYAAASVKASTRLVNDFVSWLDQRGIESQSLSATHVDEYLDGRWLGRRRRRGDAFTLHGFAQVVAPEGYQASFKREAASTPAHRTLQEFKQYLLRERGLAAATIRLYGESVGRFLENTFGDAEIRLDQVTAVDVICFVQADAARLHHPKRAQVMTTALRVFLRYGRYRGDIITDLDGCVPTVANWSMAEIPKTISPLQVQSLLAKYNQQSASGIRDYAMLLLISRLGLRASEVVELTLDDLDWTEGTIRIRGPAQHVDCLPLPADVGTALANYLRQGRLTCSVRNVFIRAQPPTMSLNAPPTRAPPI